MRVLICDDAAFMRRLLKDIVERAGFEVVAEADTGKKAVEVYKRVRPDIVTMDITMPEMDGITALKEIKKFDCSAHVLMCSAMGQKGMVVDAIKAGASDFVVKPFQAEKVVTALNKIAIGG